MNIKGASPKHFGTSVPSPLRKNASFLKPTAAGKLLFIRFPAFQWQLAFKNWHFTTKLL
jgi:hypothetical protein